MSDQPEPAVDSAPPLGTAARALVKQEPGALPSQQQQKYWQLADLPYNAAELSQLVDHYLLPYIAQRHVAHGLRSGRGREAEVLVPVTIPRIQQHYPVLASVVLQLHAQVEQEVQEVEQQQHVSSSVSPAATPSSERLLLVLRCLFLWGKHQAQEQQLPSLLQILLVRARAAAAAGTETGAEAMEDSDVEEVLDLTQDDDEVPQEQLEAFLAGECEVMLVREVQGKQQQQQQGHVRVKPDPEGKEAAADVNTISSQQQVCQKRKVAAETEAVRRRKEARLSVKRPSSAGQQGKTAGAAAPAPGSISAGGRREEGAASSRAAGAAAAAGGGKVVAAAQTHAPPPVAAEEADKEMDMSAAAGADEALYAGAGAQSEVWIDEDISCYLRRQRCCDGPMLLLLY